MKRTATEATLFSAAVRSIIVGRGEREGEGEAGGGAERERVDCLTDESTGRLAAQPRPSNGRFR